MKPAVFFLVVVAAFGAYMALSGLFRVPLLSDRNSAKAWNWFRLDPIGRAIWIGVGAILISFAAWALFSQ
jgi:hypothetical protein